jgi:hypothetical protein
MKNIWLYQRTVIKGRTIGHAWKPIPSLCLSGNPVEGPHFDGTLRLDYIDGYMWSLVEAFSFTDTEGIVHTAPEKFKTNFASTPKFMWSVLPPTGSYGPAAVIHDFLVATKSVSRDRADEIFLEMLIVLKVNPVKRWVLYRGVRIGTWWEKHGW